MKELLFMGKYMSTIFITYIVIIFVMAYIMEKIEGESRSKETRIKSPLRYMVNNNKSLYDGLYIAFIITYLYLFLVLMFIKIDEVYILYFTEAINDIVAFEGICIAFAAFTISTIIFTVSLAPKEYYLFFTRSDVLKRYHLGKIFLGICISITVTIICTGLLIEANLNNSIDLILFAIYQSMVVSVVLLGFLSLIIVGKISFSNNKFELKMLSRLYEIFWDNRRVILTQQFDITALCQNLAYLLYRYENRFGKKKKLVRLSAVDSVCYNSIENDKILIESASNIFIFFSWILLVVSCLFSWIIRSLDSFIVSILSYIVFTIVIRFWWTRNSIGKFMRQVLFSNTGFFVTLKNKKVKFIGNISIWHNILLNSYFNEIKNIMAFYCLICDSEINKEIIEKLFKDSLIFYEQNNIDQDKWTEFLIDIPVIASGYYFYLKHNEIPSCISEYFKTKNFSDKEKKKIHNFLEGLIVDTGRFRVIESEKKLIYNKYKSIEELKKHIEEIGYWKKLISGK